MNPEKKEHNEVYKETAKLFDWGFQAVGKVTPVGELVPPKGAVDSSAQPGTTASASASASGSGKGAGSKTVTASSAGGSSGVGVALAIAGGALVLLVGAAFLVNRRWPLPDLVRRRTRP
jgi:serine-type D-Ala-D-Ala carboxypeptidase (penicillin-binding protein 5/6)